MISVKLQITHIFPNLEQVTLIPTNYAFAKQTKVRARLFLFDKPMKCFAFVFAFSFHVSDESRSIATSAFSK